MARTSVTFDGVSLQTANIIASRIAHESYENRNLLVQELGNRDGGKLVQERRTPKFVQIEGHLKYDTQDLLDAAMDALKKTLNIQEANLDISFGGEIRRYKATLTKAVLPREHFNINWIPFELEFEIPEGFGKDTTISSDSTVDAVATVDRTIDVGGTLAPKPTITITINSETNLNRFIVKNVTTNRSMTVEKAYDTDTLVINMDTNEVTVNAVNQEYTGVFPEFVLGNNNYTITPNATAVDMDVTVSYTATYL